MHRTTQFHRTSAYALTRTLGALLMWGCPQKPVMPSPPDLNGDWATVGSLANTTLGVQCTESGQASINQSGDTFSGTSSGSGSCVQNGSTTPNTYSSTITNGKIQGSQISFDDSSGCTYSGTASGSPTATMMSGTESCQINVQGTPFTVTGNWSATH